jgi:glycosyltransferase involved in cell wall biosynthesis
MDLQHLPSIGIFFNVRREQGGLYQYALTLIHCLHQFDTTNKYTLFLSTSEPLPIEVTNPRWSFIRISPLWQWLTRTVEGLCLNAAKLGYQRPHPILPRSPELRGAEMDLMLYVKPTAHAFLWPFPFVFPIHDLQHRLQSRFPEVSARGEANRREYLYQNAVPTAAGILADSAIGKQDIVQLYNADGSKVHSLPYLAPSYLSETISESDLDRVRKRYALPPQYLFYPAAFWPHKNHARLLRALRLVNDREAEPTHLVLAGSRRHEYENLRQLSHILRLTDQVHFLGYVPDEDMYPLYSQAKALVMPTFFGPTNIPILEAWAMRCPVITSDIRGIREQVGKAGLLVDPEDEHALAQAIYRVLGEPDLHSTLADAGEAKIKAWTPELFADKLVQILRSASRRVSRQ